MNVRLKKINNILYFLIFFLTFTGFYSLVIFSANTLSENYAKNVSIFIRLIIGLSSISLLILNTGKFKSFNVLVYFYLFITFFLIRVLLDYSAEKYYYESYVNVIVYLLTFCVIPFSALIIIRPSKESLDSIFKGFLCGAFLLLLSVILFYREYIGSVGRLSASSTEEGIVNPLILSYNSTMILGPFIFYIFYNKVGLIKKTIIIAMIIASIIPFFLGASRGSLIALFVPFFFMIVRSDFKSKVRYMILLLVLLLFVFILDDYLNSGLLSRLGVVDNNINYSNGSDSRLIIWENSLNQFFNNPLFGDKLQVDDWKNYPHNIFVEVLQTTGVLGIIPFLLLVIQAIKSVSWIYKKEKEFIWIAVIFLQALTQYQFSGNLFTAAWFWTSMALLFASHSFLKKNHQFIN